MYDVRGRLKDGDRFKFRVLEDRRRGKTGKWAPHSELSLRSSRLVPTLDKKEAIKRADPPDVLSVVKVRFEEGKVALSVRLLTDVNVSSLG